MTDKRGRKAGDTTRLLDALELEAHIDIENVDQATARGIRNVLQYLQRSRGRKYCTRMIPKTETLRIWRNV